MLAHADAIRVRVGRVLGLMRTPAAFVFVVVFILAMLSMPFAAAHAQDAEIVTETPSSSKHSSATSPRRAPLTRTTGEPMASEADQAHLDEWLEYVSHASRSRRLLQGSNMLVAGSIVMAIGIPLYLRTPSTQLDKGLGLAGIAASGVYLASGIVHLASRSAPEKLFERWQSAKGSGLSLRELARFEGEFRGYEEHARRTLLLGRWTSFGMAITGGLILGLTPVANLSRDGRMIGYAGGGILAGMGFLSFGLSFHKATVPDSWDAYLSGKRAPPTVKWSASPTAGPKFAGASIAGRF